ncbi:MAG: peptidoglycan-binding protein [Cyanobacteria bacterium P01_A01_bin.84]
MWCGIGKSSISIACISFVAASAVVSNSGWAARQRNYSGKEFCAVLRGLGYEVKVSNSCIQTQQTKRAVRLFQKGYKLGVDGIVGPKTQDHAASIVTILEKNLNLVVKPENPLTANQFYDLQTEAVVKQYQQKLGLTPTGIADLRLRQRLNRDAKEMLDKPASTPTPFPTETPEVTPSPTPSPTETPGVTPSPTPSPTETPEVTPSPTPSPTETPEVTPIPTPSPTETPEVTPIPTPSPTETPEVTPIPTPSPTETPEVTPIPTPSPTETPDKDS